MPDDLRTAIRHELARELADDLEARLRDVATFGGSCPCNHAEARAFLAKLRRIDGTAPAAPTPRRARYTRTPR